MNCKVVVTVAGDCSHTGDITAAPDILPVPKQNHQQKIEWRIATSGFKFDAPLKGITFTAPPLPPPGEFGNAHSNGKKYDLTDANTATVPTDYKYNIQLLRSDGSSCVRKDPVIKNGS